MERRGRGAGDHDRWLERVVGSGCAAIVPANTPHSAQVLGACRAIVVDYPTREEVGGVRTAG